ncbi:hypothetical protein [Legionella impletisoli]|uniref:Uncharacterized protein n=1 Tax=Legionella impletisoli TaxID=343510 RepID=A0A917JV26_9GAMM|nr:hypothetical protein [Legionella impletisoli]GGI85134.1 hypothetical protein GCM10007966_12170 [Legionella impletisoli]
MKRQGGFLAIAAVAMIVLVGILSAAIVAMAVRASLFSIHLNAKNKAVFIAESGLEQGRKNLTQSVLANRQTCVGLSSTVSMSGGGFTVVPASDAANLINPRYSFSTLSSPISAGASPTIISVSDTSVFAPYGRVLIGREVFQYDRIANATTLAGVTRAQDGSMSLSHASGSLVSQYQCTIQSTGNSASTNPEGVRQYRQGIQQPVVFAVGENGTILRWNGASELQWDNQSPGTFNFNAISALNYHSAWAVADRQDQFNFRIARLQGNSWTNFITYTPPPPEAVNLTGVDATSTNEAWAVGDRNRGSSFTILRWVRNASNDSTNWCLLPCGGKTIDESGTDSQQRYLFAIKTLDTSGDGYADIGAAVGGRDGTGSGNRGIALLYNGSEWVNLPLPTSPATNRIGQLYGVEIVDNGTSTPRDAYFVGRSSENNSDGKLIRYRDGIWVVITVAAPLRSISVIDTDGDGFGDFGVAVGDNGVAYTFDNSSLNGPFVISGNNLTGVEVLSTTDIWVVGDNGTRLHYNGSTVESITAGVSTSNDLTGVSAIFPRRSPSSSWYDVIN